MMFPLRKVSLYEFVCISVTLRQWISTTMQEPPLVPTSVSSGDNKWHSGAFVSFTVEHNLSRGCHADDETHTHSLPWSVSPRAALFVSREMCLPRQSPATAGARMRFRSLLSQSAFPIRLNALWRRGLLHDTILRVDKWSSVTQAGPHWGRGARRQTAWGPRNERNSQPYWRFNQKQLALNQAVCRQRRRLFNAAYWKYAEIEMQTFLTYNRPAVSLYRPLLPWGLPPLLFTSAATCFNLSWCVWKYKIWVCEQQFFCSLLVTCHALCVSH